VSGRSILIAVARLAVFVLESVLLSNGETTATGRLGEFPGALRRDLVAGSLMREMANHGDPHSVPLMSHWGLISRSRCCWFSAAIAVLVFPFGLHPHSWLAQQLH